MSKRAAIFFPILMALVVVSLLVIVIIQALELGVYLQIQG